MKKTYDAPAVEILNLVSDRSVASMNFGDLKDAATNGKLGSGAVSESVSGLNSDLILPR